MKTAIITGSEGQIGRHFVSKLIELDYKVIGIDLVEQIFRGKKRRISRPRGEIRIRPLTERDELWILIRHLRSTSSMGAVTERATIGFNHLSPRNQF